MPSAVRTRKLVRVGAAARFGGRGALAALVGFLVVGILGMHALASHGTPAAPATVASMAMPGMTSGHQAATTSSGSPDAQAHAAASNTAKARTAANVDNSAGVGSGHSSAHDLGAMAMLCVVMLAAAALTLLLLLAVRIAKPLIPVAFQPAATLARTRQRVRGTGPPHAWAFSVTRC